MTRRTRRALGGLVTACAATGLLLLPAAGATAGTTATATSTTTGTPTGTATRAPGRP